MLIDGIRIEFAGRQRDYFAALFNARGRPMQITELRQIVYDPNAQGGPDDKTIQVQIHLLRYRLAATRFRITSFGKHRGWALRRVPDTALPYRPDPKYQGRPPAHDPRSQP